ncbi:hypothetical protein RRG08_028152 [Elysia crispata]|uniref:ENT domain-containing protein n=1 Tax=Elysia crispata TaxID=231223 RepID=A0AAE0YQ61_9GAST|nr:hypothetical protein RRG08_028152 [Elysia crispata]
MWPMLLDYSKDESKRILRRLELEAYASVISVFRAQGDLSKEKKSILQDLQQSLSISTERHRAEVRRAVNDEKLATIAENISGSMGTTEWQVEGRRLVPLMPRLVPQTAFTSTANQAASAMMEKNATLPPPSSTCNRDGPTAVLPKTTRSSSPSSNVVVLPSGTSIHIKGMLNQEEEEDLSTIAGRRSSQRSLSTDSQNAASSVSTQTPRVTYTTASSTATGSSPVKITISKSPQGRPINVQSSSQPPKVILVTSAGPAATVVQRSMSVPVVRSQSSPMSSVYPGPLVTSSSVSGPGHISAPRSSVLVSGVSVPSTGVPQVVSAYTGVVTSTSGASLVSTTVTMPTSSLGGNSAVFSPSLQMGLGKIRPRIVPRQRYPAMVPQHQKPGVVLPMGPQLVSPLPQAVSLSSGSGPTINATGPPQQTQYSSASIQVKTLNKPTIQIKQEGGMKIITQGGSSKILPKPSQLANASGPPVVMVNTGQGTQGTTTGITMLPRSISTYTGPKSGGNDRRVNTLNTPLPLHIWYRLKGKLVLFLTQSQANSALSDGSDLDLDVGESSDSDDYTLTLDERRFVDAIDREINHIQRMEVIGGDGTESDDDSIVQAPTVDLNAPAQWIADPNGFVPQEQLQCTRREAGQEQGLAHRVVKDLVEPFHHTGMRVYMGNFCTGVPLLRDLEVCGMVRSNRKFLPADLLPKKVQLQKHEYKTAQAGHLTFSVWLDTSRHS